MLLDESVCWWFDGSFFYLVGLVGLMSLVVGGLRGLFLFGGSVC